MDRIAAETLGDDFRTALAGDSKEFRESSSSLMFAFLLAILLIYLILAAQFESFKDPLVIMLTVPLAIAGALVFMAANGQTMNIFSQIGIIMQRTYRHGYRRSGRYGGIHPADALHRPGNIQLRIDRPE